MKGIGMKKSLPHDAYTQLADEYSARIDTKPHNAFYERPAVQSLVPDVKNKNILDAGCGPGVYSEWLLQQGATVTGIDANETMLKHARARLGKAVALIHANLEEPIDFLANNEFDGIISPLTITYVKNHSQLFKEFSRILKDKGWFVFSTEHPFFSYQYFGVDNYFEARQVECEWKGFKSPVTMQSYYHSLGSIFEALAENNFVVDNLLEPLPTEKFHEVDEERYNRLMKFPLFICIRARKIYLENTA